MIESYIFTSSLREYLRLKRIAVWVLFAVALFGIGSVYHSIDTVSSKQDAYIILSAVLVYRVLPLAAAIFSMAIVSQEVEQRTIVYPLTRPVARWKLITFRSLAAATVVFLIAALAESLVSFAAYGAGNPRLLHDLIALAVGAFAYVSLFVFVSLLINRAMVVCLLFAFAWETSVPGIPGDMYRLTINSYLATISQRPTSAAQNQVLSLLGGMSGENTISQRLAWMTMLGLILLLLAASSYWFTHFEFTAREDA